MEPKHTYGGQAVIEGVMIRGQKHIALAVRNHAGRICTRSLEVPTWSTGRFRKVPFIRGILIFAETLVVGLQALATSAAISIEDDDVEEQPKEGGNSLGTNLGIGFALLVSIGLGIGIFFLAPFFLSDLLKSHGLSPLVVNLVEGVIRLGIFLAYLWLIARMGEIQRVLAYHGAEHMSIHARENGDPVTVQNVRKYSTAHPRCGTSFLLTVMVVAILVFLFIPRHPFLLVVLSRIVLIPLIASLSYEFIRYAGLNPDNRIVRWLVSPNLLLQKLTTRQPDDAQIEVAISALSYAVELDEEGEALEGGFAASATGTADT